MAQHDQPLHRLGIIGTGSRGRNLIECLKHSGRGQVVCAADPSEVSRSRAKDMLAAGCPLHTDPRYVLDDPNVDIAYIGTPNHTHADLVISALDAGKDVFSEKPMATSVEDCDRMISAIERTGRFFALTMQNRYSFATRMITDMLRDGTLGKLVMMWCHEFRKPFSRMKVDDWIVYREKSGGPFVEKNSHHWDILNFWGQSSAKTVHALTTTTGIHKPGDIWDCGWVNVEYENGIIANLGLSMITPHGHDLTMTAIGTEGWVEGIRTPDGGTVKFHENSRPEEKVFRANLPPEQAQLGHAGAEFMMLEHLFDSIEAGVEPQTNCWWGRESIIIGVAAERSAAEGRVVQVDEIRAESRFPKAMPVFQNAETSVSK